VLRNLLKSKIGRSSTGKENEGLYSFQLKDSSGFTLLEVLIATTVFAFFSAALLVTQGFNVSDSTQMRSELVLQRLCQNKINEIILNPPEFSDSLTLTPETGDFDEEGYGEYEYSIEWKRLTIPDLQKITGEKGGEEEDRNKDLNESQSQTDLKNKVFELFKKNVEEKIWQVQISVKAKDSDFVFSLSTFVSNEKAKLNLNLPF